MSTGESGPSAVASRPRSWPLFLAGVLLFVVGPVAYALQIRAKQLAAPWYVPVLATAGVVFMAASLWRRHGVVRAVFLVLFALVCGFEWYGLAVAMKTPAYAGPAQPGRKVPAFVTRLADGTPFSERDLEQGTRTVLVFYRGRW